MNFAGATTHPVVVCSNGLGLSNALHSVSLSATAASTVGNGLDFFVLSAASTIGGNNAAGCRVYTK